MTPKRPAAQRRTERPVDFPRSGTCGVACLALACVALLTGCSEGIRWEGPTYPDAQALARRTSRLTFVYLRRWYLVECTDFEEKVLKDPAVLAETRSLVCVPLDYDWDRPLAEQWKLTVAPAFAIVAPSGQVLVRQQAPISRDELLQAFREAKAAFASSTQPVPRPP